MKAINKGMVNLGSPMNNAHPLNKGRLFWLKSFTMGPFFGGPTLYNLTAFNGGNSVGIGTAFGTRSTASVSGPPTWVGNGHSGGRGTSSLLFASANKQYVDCGDGILNGVFGPTNNFTVAGWFLQTSSGGIALMTHGSGSWYLRINAGKLDFLKSQITDYNSGVASISLNTWYHAAVTVDSGNNFRTFVNGQSDATGTSALAGSSHKMMLGAENPNDAVGNITEFWDGYLDGWSYWNYAMPLNQIQMLYAEESANFPGTLNYFSGKAYLFLNQIGAAAKTYIGPLVAH